MQNNESREPTREEIVAKWKARRERDPHQSEELDGGKKWKIAFWTGCSMAGIATCLILYGWGVWSGSEPGPEWVLYFHPFPLSLFLTLMIWLYFRAFKGSAHYTGKGLNAYFMNLVPGAVFYGLALALSLELERLSPKEVEALGWTFFYLFGVEAVALFLLCLQVVFAIRMFRSPANE